MQNERKKCNEKLPINVSVNSKNIFTLNKYFIELLQYPHSHSNKTFSHYLKMKKIFDYNLDGIIIFSLNFTICLYGLLWEGS